MRNIIAHLFHRSGYPAATHYFHLLTDITLEDLANYEVVILDKDNLLVPYRASHLSNAHKTWVTNLLAAGKKVFILSNCPQRGKRANHLAQIAQELGIEAHSVFGRRRKPRAHGFLAIKEVAGVPVEKICMIGDQHFTDVAGARRQKMAAFYVKPCGKDGWHSRHKRWLEGIYFWASSPAWNKNSVAK